MFSVVKQAWLLTHSHRIPTQARSKTAHHRQAVDLESLAAVQGKSNKHGKTVPGVFPELIETCRYQDGWSQAQATKRAIDLLCASQTSGVKVPRW